MILCSIISQIKEMRIHPLVQRPKVFPGASQKEHNVPRAASLVELMDVKTLVAR